MPTNRGEYLRVPKPGQLFLWTVLTDDLDDATSLDRFLLILSADERNEAQRFRQSADRARFIIAHSLLRLALSHHFQLSTDAWRFERDHNRKPILVAPEITPKVQFNISHTQGRVACLITLSSEAGVDVEEIAYNHDHTAMAGLILSPSELNALSVLTGKNKTERFFDYWTLKEAYAKARGLGLLFSLTDVGFEFGSDNRIRAHFPPKVVDDPSAWTFWRLCLASRHIVSVAAKRDLGGEYLLILRSVTLSATGGSLLSFTDSEFRCDA